MIRNVINLEVRGRVIYLDDGYMRPTEGNRGRDFVAISLDDEWEELTKTVTFYREGIERKPLEWDGTSEILIPWEVIENDGYFYVTVDGVNGDDTRLISVSMGSIGIEVSPAGKNEGLEPSEPTKTLFSRLLDLYNDLVEKLNSGFFKGDKGDQGDSPSAKVERVTGGAVITVTDADGTTTAEVYDGQGGGGGASTWDEIAGKPDFKPVATSGDYNDLTGKPTIPAEVTDATVAGWGYKKSFTETDPTVPSWAKQPSKPTYTAQEVGALPSDTQLFSGDYNDLSNRPTIPTVPADVSAFRNDAGYLTEHQDISGKQDKLTPGDNITIEGNVISAAMYDDTAIVGKVEKVEETVGAIFEYVSMSPQDMTPKMIQDRVASGIGADLFPIGTILTVPWTDTRTSQNKVWDYPFVVAHHLDGKNGRGMVTTKDGKVKPGMVLQSLRTLPFATQFDDCEALYYAASELPAGTYYFTIKNTWSQAAAGTYQFTITKKVPAGGQIAGMQRIADTAPSTWKVSTYETPASTTPIETVDVTAASGTPSMNNLGDFIPAGSERLNSIQRVGYGYNRWAHSGLRQFLNSSANAGAWWTKQNDYDRPPTYLAATKGFMAGFGENFINVLGEVKMTTQRNNVSDDGGNDETYDKFFLASAEQHFYNTYLGTTMGVEGEAWDWFRQVAGSTTPLPGWQTFPQMITYGLDNPASSRYVFERSAIRSDAYAGGCTHSSGNLNSYHACNGYYAAPACIIC